MAEPPKYVYHLPNEILSAIVSAVDDLDDERVTTLGRLRLANKALCSMTTTAYFRVVPLKGGQEKSEEQMRKLARSGCVGLVREIVVSPHAVMPYAWVTAATPRVSPTPEQLDIKRRDFETPYDRRYQVTHDDLTLWGCLFLRSFSTFLHSCHDGITTIEVESSPNPTDSSIKWEFQLVRVLQACFSIFEFPRLRRVTFDLDDVSNLWILRKGPVPRIGESIELDASLFYDPFLPEFSDEQHTLLSKWYFAMKPAWNHWNFTPLPMCLQRLEEFVFKTSSQANNIKDNYELWMLRFVVADMPYLEELTLHFHRPVYIENLRDIPDTEFPYERLRVLDMANWSSNEATSLWFARYFEDCHGLESLSLRDICLPDPAAVGHEGWAAVFATLEAFCTRLVEIRFRHLFYASGFVGPLYEAKKMKGYDWPRPLESGILDDYPALRSLCEATAEKRKNKGLSPDSYLAFCVEDDCMSLYTLEMHDAIVTEYKEFMMDDFNIFKQEPYCD